MKIELTVAVCWLTRDTDDSYEDALTSVLERCRRSAERYLQKRTGTRDNAGEADTIVLHGLNQVQRTLLDQYLPDLNRVKGVNLLWPWWDAHSIRVLGENGALHRLEPPHPADRSAQSLGSRSFTFYRSDQPESRFRWLFHVLQDVVDKQFPKTVRSMEPIDENSPTPRQEAPSRSNITDQDWSDGIRALVSKDQIPLALTPWPGADDAQRQRKSRARKLLRQAVLLVSRAQSDTVARIWRERVQAAPEEEKNELVRQYSRRYPK